MAAGIPIIGAGFPQVLDLCRDEGVGIGLAQGNADEIAQAVLEMRNHREHWQQVGRRNRELAQQKYSWGRVAEQVESVLKKAVDG
jgi:glycosyltransferase involved in cell wall biosynthesis